MRNEHAKPAFRMIFLITSPKLANKAMKLFSEENIPLQYQFRGRGTATKGILNILGLDSVDKTILICMLPKRIADSMIIRLRKRLNLELPNSGVAFTIPLSGCSHRIMKMIEELCPEKEEGSAAERKEAKMEESDYSVIMTIINQGFSEEVMEAARPAGAGGGTVFHSRRADCGDTIRFFGIRVQQEREIVIILAKKSDKRAIMQAINEKCGMKSEAQGVVFSMPVDGVVGLE